jgi:hypothetical protein
MRYELSYRTIPGEDYKQFCGAELRRVYEVGDVLGEEKEFSEVIVTKAIREPLTDENKGKLYEAIVEEVERIRSFVKDNNDA